LAWFSAREIIDLCEALDHCQGIKHFCLAGLDSLEQDLVLELLDFLTGFPNITRLCLVTNKLGELPKPIFTALCNVISQYKKLTVLELQDDTLDKLGCEQLQSLNHTLQQCQNLKTLRLWCRARKDGTDEYLSLDKILKNITSITELALSNNKIGILPTDIFTAWCNVLGQYKKLTSIDLSYNLLHKLTPEQLTRLTQALQRCGNLKKLSLRGNLLHLFREPQFNALINLFENVEELDLSASGLRDLNDKNLAFLYARLSNCKRLKKLTLDDNNLGRFSMQQFRKLIDSLNSCHALETLILTSRYEKLTLEQTTYLKSKTRQWVNLRNLQYTHLCVLQNKKQ
jgi:Ran GTPase-activating protein (RanGAP) involved in mRNA processing and transport